MPHNVTQAQQDEVQANIGKVLQQHSTQCAKCGKSHTAVKLNVCARCKCAPNQLQHALSCMYTAS
jgi:predicted Zn-ribbon and HTH transcriptional regulator